MGKIVATYLVRVTIREPEPEDDKRPPDWRPPTSLGLEEAIAADLEARTQAVVHTDAERTDR